MAILLADLILDEKLKTVPLARLPELIGVSTKYNPWRSKMRIEFFLLPLLLAAAFVGSRHMTPVKKRNEVVKAPAAAPAELDDEHRHYRHAFCIRYAGIRDQITADLDTASHYADLLRKWRRMAKECTCTIEWALAEQDKLGLVTSGSELTVLTNRQYLEGYESSLLECRRVLLLNVGKVRDNVVKLQTLSQTLRDWVSDKSEPFQERAHSLCGSMDADARRFFDDAVRMHVGPDEEPVGIEDRFVTAKVTEFRKERAEARIRIRAHLAATAQEKGS